MTSMGRPSCSPLFVLCSNTDVHTVASLLKLYLRELPEPVIPFHKYDEFLTCAKLLGKDDETVGKRTRRAVNCFSCTFILASVKSCIAQVIYYQRSLSALIPTPSAPQSYALHELYVNIQFLISLRFLNCRRKTVNRS